MSVVACDHSLTVGCSWPVVVWSGGLDWRTQRVQVQIHRWLQYPPHTADAAGAQVAGKYIPGQPCDAPVVARAARESAAPHSALDRHAGEGCLSVCVFISNCCLVRCCLVNAARATALSLWFHKPCLAQMLLHFRTVLFRIYGAVRSGQY